MACPAAPSARPRRSRLRRIAAALVALLASGAMALLATEALLRWSGVGPWGVSEEIRWMFMETAEGTVLTTPGWRGHQTVEGRVTEVRLNSLGMRGPELPASRQPHEKRVLVLGDSFVWGYGVAEEETFASVLQQRLADGDASPVLVGNAGAPSYGLAKQLATLRRLRAGFQPDLVVACTFLGNDFDDDARRLERVIDGYWLYGWSARFAEVSWRGRNMIRFRTAQLVEKWLSSNLPALAIDSQRIAELTREQTELAAARPRPEGLYMDSLELTAVHQQRLDRAGRLLAEIRDAAAPAPVLVVVIPSPFEISRQAFEEELTRQGLDPADFERGLAAERISSAASALGLSCLDLTPLLAAEPDPERNWQPLGRHFSVEGNARVAQLLEPSVRRLLAR